MAAGAAAGEVGVVDGLLGVATAAVPGTAGVSDAAGTLSEPPGGGGNTGGAGVSAVAGVSVFLSNRLGFKSAAAARATTNNAAIFNM